MRKVCGCVMAYMATAEGSLPSVTAAPGVLALQRALVWLVGASGAIVFIEPSPYELVTLAASIIFFATGLRLRLAFIPLLLLLVLLNIGYSVGAVPVMDKPGVSNWIATSWYMAVTVMFFATVITGDTEARLDMLRGGSRSPDGSGSTRQRIVPGGGAGPRTS